MPSLVHPLAWRPDRVSSGAAVRSTAAPSIKFRLGAIEIGTPTPVQRVSSRLPYRSLGPQHAKLPHRLAAIRLGALDPPVGPPRGAAGQVEDFSAISPDAEIRPHRRPVDLQAGFCHLSLRNIVLAMGRGAGAGAHARRWRSRGARVPRIHAAA